MQLLGRLMDHVLKARGQRATIVGATSGDTGSAAIEAFRGLSQVDVFILYPHGRVSEVQRRQMTTVAADNIHALAKAKGVKPNEINVLILDRPRHAALIDSVRSTGASIRLITDGDVAGVIFTAMQSVTGIDLYLGSGGAPEGVLAAAALRCVGGQMQGRLVLDTQAKVERARGMGISDPKRKYDMEELASDDVIVSATGVTDGSLMHGVRFKGDVIETETIVYRSITGTVRRIHGEHRELSKFLLD
jgi:fructose-1,6-bisphosphatase II / sedoheptulose-1,7-bisphosphatase